MAINIEHTKRILEAAIITSVEPVSLTRLSQLFADEERPTTQELRGILQTLEEEYQPRGVELKKVATGYRFQVSADIATHLATWVEEPPARFSRAALETLALIAYKQPITRAEVEEIRGVAVSTNILRNLQEREWVTIVGHKDVPGRPALYATTPKFLNDLNLHSITQLPALLHTHEEEGAEQLALQLGLELQSIAEPSPTTDEVLALTTQTDTPDESVATQIAEIIEAAETPEMPEASDESLTCVQTETIA